MSDLKVSPTAQSGYEKFKAHLGPSFRTSVVWVNKKQTVEFEIRKENGWLSRFDPVIAKVYMWDSGAKIEVYDNNHLETIMWVTKKFEAEDARKIKIETWR